MYVKDNKGYNRPFALGSLFHYAFFQHDIDTYRLQAKLAICAFQPIPITLLQP